LNHKNPYQSLPAKVEKVITETSNIKTFILKPEREFAFKTGQFIELSLPGVGEAPFTPSSNPSAKERLEVTIMKVGMVTERLHNINEGVEVGIRGPYGYGYPLEEFKGREIYVVGGGVGLAPLRSFLLSLLNDAGSYKKIVLRYGAKTPQDIMYKEEVKTWSKNGKIDVALSVDKGDGSWKGNVGVVTTILNKKDVDVKDAVTIVCGPPVMMKFATFKLLELGFKEENIYLSMEKNMSCGVGKCGHCRLGEFYVCKDGPVFTYNRIKHIPEIWD